MKKKLKTSKNSTASPTEEWQVGADMGGYREVHIFYSRKEVDVFLATHPNDISEGGLVFPNWVVHRVLRYGKGKP